MALIRDCRDVAAWGGPEIGVNATLANNRQQSTAFGSIVPPNGCSVLQKISIFQGDGKFGSSTSYRCLSYLAPSAPSYTSGYESWLVIAVLLPAGYPNAATSVFVAPWEMHHSTQPTGVAPAHWAFSANGMDLNSYGGSFAAGGLGNPGRQTNISTTFTGARFTARLRWHVGVIHYKHGFNNDGAFGFDYGLEGTDAAVGSLVDLTGKNTMFGNRTNYVEHGLYCGNDTTFTMYQAGTMEFSTRQEAIDWANTMLGGTVVPGPPPPDPTLDQEPPRYMGGPYVRGNQLHGSTVDYERCSIYPAAKSGICTHLREWIEPQAVAGQEKVKLDLWSITVGEPDVLLGTTAELLVDSTMAAAWYELPLVTPVAGIVAGDLYAVGDHRGGVPNIADTRKTTATNAFRLLARPYASGPANWDAASDAPFDILMNIVMIGTVDAPGGAGGQVDHVQSQANTVTGSSSTTIAKAFDNPVADGNLIRVDVSWGAFTSGETIAVTDNRGNTYTQLDRADDTVNHQALATFYAKNVTGGTVTVTATFGTSRDYRRIIIKELHGADTTSPIDSHTINANATGTTAADNITSGTVTPATDGCFIDGVVCSTSTLTPSVSAGSGEVPRQTIGDLLNEDKQQDTAAAVASTFTFGVNAVKYHAAVVAIVPAAAPPPPPATLKPTHHLIIPRHAAPQRRAASI